MKIKHLRNDKIRNEKRIISSQEHTLFVGTKIRKYAVSDGIVITMFLVNYSRFIFGGCQ